MSMGAWISTLPDGSIYLDTVDADGERAVLELTPSEARFYAGELLRAAIVAEDLTKKAAERLHAEMARDARARTGGGST